MIWRQLDVDDWGYYDPQTGRIHGEVRYVVQQFEYLGRTASDRVYVVVVESKPAVRYIGLSNAKKAVEELV